MDYFNRFDLVLKNKLLWMFRLSNLARVTKPNINLLSESSCNALSIRF